MKKLILILMLIAGVAGAATIQSTGGGGSLASGTSAITGGTAGGVCSDQSDTLTCADACTINETTNTLTCTAFSGPLTGTASLATALAGGAADQVMVQTGAGAGTFRTLPTSVQNGPAVTAEVVYDSNTDLFSGREGYPNPALSGRYPSYCMMASTTVVVFTCAGEAAPSNAGTSPVVAADATTFLRQYITYTTKSGTPTSGDATGIRSAANLTMTNYLPKGVWRIATPATITTMRIWAGFTGADISGNADSTTNIGTGVAAFAYDTGGAADVTKWHVVTCVGSGGANTCTATDTAVAVTLSHEYLLVLEFTSTANLYWRITDVTAATTTTGGPITSNVPATTALMGTQITATTLTGAQRAVWVSSTTVEQN